MILLVHCAGCGRDVHLPLVTARAQSRRFNNHNYCLICEPRHTPQETR